MAFLDRTCRCDGGENGRGVWRPGDVGDRCAEFEGEKSVIWPSGIPKTHRPVLRSREEDVWMKTVPLCGIDGQRVATIGIEIFRIVFRRATMDGAAFCPNEIRRLFQLHRPQRIAVDTRDAPD